MKSKVISEILDLYDRVSELEMENKYLSDKVLNYEESKKSTKDCIHSQTMLEKYGLEKLWESTSKSYYYKEIRNGNGDIRSFDKWFDYVSNDDDIPDWMSKAEWKNLVHNLAYAEYSNRISNENVSDED